MDNKSKFRPFSNGTEMMVWLDRNCDRCKKSEPLTKGMEK